MLAWLLVGEIFRVACFSSQESDKREDNNSTVMFSLRFIWGLIFYNFLKKRSFKILNICFFYSAPDTITPSHILPLSDSLFSILIFCQMKSMLFLLTCLVFILNVVGGNDAVSIKSLCPPEIHTAIFHFSHLQLRRVWGL